MVVGAMAQAWQVPWATPTMGEGAAIAAPIAWMAQNDKEIADTVLSTAGAPAKAAVSSDPRCSLREIALRACIEAVPVRTCPVLHESTRKKARRDRGPGTIAPEGSTRRPREAYRCPPRSPPTGSPDGADGGANRAVIQ